MNDTFYFSHDLNARNDPKIQKLLRVHGLAGIGLYWCIIEMLYEQDARIMLASCEDIAFTMHTELDLVNSIINEFGLFDNDGDFFWSNSVNKRIDKMEKEKEKRMNGAKARWSKLNKNNNIEEKNNASTMQSQCEHDAGMMLADANKLKENKIKENKINNNSNICAESTKRFLPPTQQEVEEVIKEKGYHFSAEEFIAYYESNGWKVGRNQMKSWKAAMVTWERNETKGKGYESDKQRLQDRRRGTEITATSAEDYKGRF